MGSRNSSRQFDRQSVPSRAKDGRVITLNLFIRAYRGGGFVVRRAARRARTARGLLDGCHLRGACLLDQIAPITVAWRCPGARVPRLAIRVVVHLVDRLEREVGGLVQEEEDKDRCEEVACCVCVCKVIYRLAPPTSDIRTCKNVAVFVLDVARDEGREEREEEVPEPVGSGCQRALLRTRPGWESLANQNPDTPANVVSNRVTEAMLRRRTAPKLLRSPR